jgi:hypothetical protein
VKVVECLSFLEHVKLSDFSVCLNGYLARIMHTTPIEPLMSFGENEIKGKIQNYCNFTYFNVYHLTKQQELLM